MFPKASCKRSFSALVYAMASQCLIVADKKPVSLRRLKTAQALGGCGAVESMVVEPGGLYVPSNRAWQPPRGVFRVLQAHVLNQLPFWSHLIQAPREGLCTEPRLTRPGSTEQSGDARLSATQQSCVKSWLGSWCMCPRQATHDVPICESGDLVLSGHMACWGMAGRP